LTLDRRAVSSGVDLVMKSSFVISHTVSLQLRNSDAFEEPPNVKWEPTIGHSCVAHSSTDNASSVRDDITDSLSLGSK
jgi:hypothetical protein